MSKRQKKAKSVLKNPAQSLPREPLVMRFSSNEGQNMAPDVILILIKEGRVLVMEGGLESILLNTINPFFRFGGNRAAGRRFRPSSVFSLPPSAPCFGDAEVDGR